VLDGRTGKPLMSAECTGTKELCVYGRNALWVLTKDAELRVQRPLGFDERCRLIGRTLFGLCGA